MVDKDLMDMLVRELKDELEARSESKTGNKAWLRRRLHGALVRDHLDAAGQTFSEYHTTLKSSHTRRALSLPFNVLAELARTFNVLI